MFTADTIIHINRDPRIRGLALYSKNAVITIIYPKAVLMAEDKHFLVIDNRNALQAQTIKEYIDTTAITHIKEVYLPSDEIVYKRSGKDKRLV